MRILLVMPESPFVPAGGIATYVDNAIQAHVAAGNEVFLLTWGYSPKTNFAWKLLRDDQHQFLVLDGADIWFRRPNGPYDVAVSEYLLPSILDVIERFGPDLIESTDYLAPLHHFLMLKRAGLLPVNAARIPVLIYNHGLKWEIYRANAAIPSMHAQAEIIAERNVLRWADIVFAPSATALKSMHRQMSDDINAYIVPEPFVWGNKHFGGRAPGRYVSLGRVAFSKGIDYCIHFLNIARNLHPIETVEFIGGFSPTTFRTAPIEDYIRKRLHPELRDKLILRGSMDREDALRTCAGGGFSLNFSLPETYNYVFLEMLSAGLTPYVLAGTAMAEFVPDGQSHILIPQDFIDRDIAAITERIRTDPKGVWEAVASNAAKISAPQTFIENYDKVARLRVSSDVVRHSRRQLNGGDVTVLMAAHNETQYIEATVRSVFDQDEPPAELVIVDDGSNDPAAIQKLEEIRHMGNVRVIYAAANEGLCATRVKLLDLCNTKLAIFLDADDLLDHQFISRTLEAYNSSPVQPNAVTTWRQNFGVSNEQVCRFNWDDHMLFLSNDLRMTGLVEIAALKHVGFHSSMRNGEADDWDFWLRFKEAGYKLICVPDLLFHYRFAPGTMSWPWSEGQAALTSQYIAKQLFQAINRGKISDAVLVDYLSQYAWRPSDQPAQSVKNIVISTRRLAYVAQIENAHPLAFRAMRMAIQLTTGIAKRLAKATPQA